MSQPKSLKSSSDQVMMTLCAIAYLPYRSTQELQRTLNEAEALGRVHDAIWSTCDKNDSVYVVRNRINGEYTIAIKGPVFRFGLSLIFDLYDELEIGREVHFPYSQQSDIRIAAGILTAIQRINNLVCDGRTLGQVINNFPKGSKVYVTGHGLGGTAAAAYAARLANSNLKELEIIPYSFGAPVAGNWQFADLFNPNSRQCIFPRSSRRVNIRDMIPFLWHDLQGIPSIDYGDIKCPVDFTLCLDCITRMLIINQTAYVAPVSGFQLQGKAVADISFFQETTLQHQPNTYLALLGLNPIGTDVFSNKEQKDDALNFSLNYSR